MAHYRVVGKHLYRASIIATVMGTAPDGTPLIVQQPGPMERCEVGTVLTDIRPDELKAFGDRLTLISDEQAAAESYATAQRETAAQQAALDATVQESRAAAEQATQAAVVAEETAKEAMRVAALKEEEVRHVEMAPPTRTVAATMARGQQRMPMPTEAPRELPKEPPKDAAKV